MSRRDFLRVGSLSVVGLSVAEKAALARLRAAGDNRSVVFILMSGGASQFETFDPKPDAGSDIRGPMKAISTSVPGIALSESLPMLAERAQRFALIRSLHHDAAPIHETGLQLLQTGRLCKSSLRHPHFGSVVAKWAGPRDRVPPTVVLPTPITDTGVATYRGQEAGFLGSEFEPLTPTRRESESTDDETSSEFLYDSGWELESDVIQRTYGDHRFGRLCLQARQLVESGVRCVTVNLFDRLQGEATWDCHGSARHSPATLYDYRDQLCPQFDQAVSALLDDLAARGLLDKTLVVAVGEFGRTAKINPHVGREHWPGVWSALVAGGGVQGGQVIGASDKRGTEPLKRPVAPGELTATIYQALNIDPTFTLAPNEETELPLVDHEPIHELFS